MKSLEKQLHRIVAIYATMFLKIHLDLRIPEGFTLMQYLRNYKTFFCILSSEDTSLMEQGVKNISFNAWMKPAI